MSLSGTRQAEPARTGRGPSLQGNAGSVGLSGFFRTLLKLTVVNIADRDMIAPTVTISQCRAACAAAQGLSR